ncbi:inter-alpha-trypsin inhibitor heavy chain H4-like isoform X4 [Pectinophora gossypiella]|uniref:inter-alpha-trypsin inhibitor heavy chain H4-like isoform X4 n=1 Tax=Pectinophora gossypiella TaxID=13191 RepID=UPI00214E0D3D|nr:inter-alpha-trypsin inhibitor heavy chain H4-like isoform X4 [Pectinophora gossypiella]
MGTRWLGVLGCLCALVVLGHSAAVPTQDTLVVARSDEEGTTSSPVDSTTEEVTKIQGPTTEEPSPPVKLTEMTVNSEVTMRYAHTAVVTRVRNPAKRAQEATFRVLLPETAFISGFTMILDGKPYKAYVKEKEEAKQIYSQAVSHGIGAAHIAAKARDSNHFTVSVNVEPNTTAVFNLTYEELLVRRNNVYNHAINLHPGGIVPKLSVTVHIREAQKITELRVPEVRTGNEIDASEDDAQNSQAVITRGHDDREATITFSPDLDEQRRLMQIYAQKSKETQSHSHSWYPETEESQPDGILGQFVVQYDVDRPKEGEILVNDGYFVHFYAPKDLPPLNKHVVFVLDTSGSMMDRKIVQLREAMQTILGELNPGDYFNIVEFATSVKVYDLQHIEEPPKNPSYSYFSFEVKPPVLQPPSPATPENIARAKTIVSRLTANGGTNIASALNVAVDLIQKGIGWTPETTPANATSDNEAPRALPQEEKTAETTTETPKVEKPEQTELAKPDNKDDDKIKLEPIIIFLTDGDPTVGETDPARIITRLSEKNYGENKATIFSLAFGEDADRKFLRKLSLRNEGFMRHIYEAADAALQLRDFYRQVSSPLLADVHFQYPKDQVKEGSVTKNKFRAVYAGSETVVAGYLADTAVELTPRLYGICGVDDGFIRKKYEIFPKVPVARPAGEYLPLERLWAYLTIKQLLDQQDAADEPLDKEKEKDDENTPEKKALKLALKYSFVTPLTSLVVVKPNATNAVDAESVDKQDSFNPSPPVPAYAFGSSSMVGGPGFAAASGLAGMPGAPQFAYSHVLSSHIADDIPVWQAESALDVEEEDMEGPAYLSDRSGGGDEFMPLDYYTGESLDLSTPYVPTTTYVPSAVPPVDQLAVLHLTEYPWVRSALKPDSDAIQLSLKGNDTSADIAVLDLTRDDVAPKEAEDAECARATDGAAGVCVYLTRCDAAKNITLEQYKETYCSVNKSYAGVCCPRAQVDVAKA